MTVLNPKITFLSHKQLSGKILNEAVTEFIFKIEKIAQNGIQWLLESVLITLSGEPLIWKAQDVSAKRSCTNNIILKVEELFNKLEFKNINAIALVTDSTAAYAAARKQLQKSPTFKNVIDDATTVTSYFENILIAKYKPCNDSSDDESSDFQSTSELLLLYKICDIINNDNCKKKSPFNITTSKQFGSDVIGYWDYYISCAKELDQFHKVLAISQLRGIINRNHYVQELKELKKLNNAISTTFLLSHNNKKYTSIVQDTNNEDGYIEIKKDEDDDDILLWTSISDDNTNENAL
ncbi:hypothetical protein C2G38_2198654 [Gigaspora rosea]|uniref:DUF659 domain-containing protein n=1 Tax=Gigaspora rosea TaxID=44941 RepID=A0A397USD7_9GLOM|nr:hypothetical protein C2G38_2198654 [Gigaspora rosea]